MSDVWTVMWREFKDMLLQRGTVRATLMNTLLPVIFMGVVMPWQMGGMLIAQPLVALTWIWIPMLFVTMVVAEAFAGERERHTLETLLASRLSDRAILFGKLAATVAYGVAMAGLVILSGMITVYFSHWGGRPVGRLLLFGISALLICVPVAAFSASVGVLISLRAATVRQAAQTTSLLVMAPALLLVLLPVVPPSWHRWLFEHLAGLTATQAIALVEALIVLVDVLIILIAMARFQRTRLILD